MDYPTNAVTDHPNQSIMEIGATARTHSSIDAPTSLPNTAQPWLKRSLNSWFSLAFLGQLAFVGFILAYYGVRTLSGDFAAWNDKPLIQGYTPDDAFGNFMFISHVLVAAVITLGGLHQLIPVVRRRWPVNHRVVGRVFCVTGYFMALGGLWLVWGRGTQLSFISAIPTSLNALLIIVFLSFAWRHALQRNFATHRRWALRAFVAVNGVWFFRIGIMSWIILNGGPRGMNETLSGPADIALSFGSFVVPLAILELYLLAEASAGKRLRTLASGALLTGTAVTGIGVFGTVAFMWWPYI